MRFVVQAAWAVLLGISTGAQAETPPPLPAAAFAATGEFEQLLLSPDSALLAGMVRIKDRRALVVQRVDGSERRIAFTLDQPDMDFELIRWLGTDRLLARLTTYKAGGRGELPLPFSRLLALQLDASQPQVLNPEHRTLWANRTPDELPQACDTPDHVLLPAGMPGEDGPVQRLHARRGEIREASPPLPQVADRYWADALGQVRLAEQRARDGSRHWWLRQPDAQAQLGSWRLWRSASAEQAESWRPLGFDADPQQLLALHEGRLLRVPLQGEAPPTPLLTLPAGSRPQRLLRSGADCRAVGLLLADGKRLWFGDQLDALERGIAAALPEQQVELLQWQGDRYLVRASTEAEPPEYLLGRRSVGELQRVEWPTSPLTGRVEVQRLELADGGLLLHPGGTPRPLPLVVCVACELHPHDDNGRFRPLQALLVQRGYAVWTPNLPIRLRSGDRLLGQSQAWGDELLQALPAVAKTGWTDATRLALMGNQAGAYLLLQLAQRGDERVKALLLTAPLTDLMLMRERARDSNLSRATQASHRALLGERSAEQLRALSPVQQVERLHVPTLLLHGDHDARLSIEHSRRLHEALKAQGTPSRLLEFAKSDGDLDHPPYRIQAYEAIEAWLAKYLRP